jgi:C1A family cysteine protease
MRKMIFAKADAFIKEHNSTEAGWKLGHNHMSDWNEAEYRSLLGYNGATYAATADREVYLSTEDLPAEKDWVKDGAVTPIKDQGGCGSCWAFSTTGSTEGAHFIAAGELLSFSEQQLVDCDHEDHGCGGGLMDNAFRYFEKNKVVLEKDYPYTGKDGACKVVTPTDV